MAKDMRRLYGIAVVLVVTMLASGATAQDTSCLNRLAPCLNYLNGSGDVPDSCCDPLKSVINNNPDCLCSLISNQGSRQAEQAGINVNEAQKLPGRCGQHVNPISCLSGAGAPSSMGSEENSAGRFSLPSTAIAVLTIVQMFLFVPNNVLA
ncbi:lipid transfer-like protein VAS [Tripterygium wilfordii]|uniref:Lipid transfer-like protein VAS n=1 Tax=Tripterygium wilfordii TaxID=458696 RepID=A0A7J7BUL9_TRIWF|nr:non-specific lipid transfer protein GPI-anchored 30 [Tripterygium wilfordii]KAF5725600.1 lipid transfer-like protein VAS [Tripterygium wilfordii]